MAAPQDRVAWLGMSDLVRKIKLWGSQFVKKFGCENALALWEPRSYIYQVRNIHQVRIVGVRKIRRRLQMLAPKTMLSIGSVPWGCSVLQVPPQHISHVWIKFSYNENFHWHGFVMWRFDYLISCTGATWWKIMKYSETLIREKHLISGVLQNLDTIMRHTIVGESGLILTTWSSLACTQGTVHGCYYIILGKLYHVGLLFDLGKCALFQFPPDAC